jgi:hypothetical protein
MSFGECLPSLSFFGDSGVTFIGCTAIVLKALLFGFVFIISVVCVILLVGFSFG